MKKLSKDQAKRLLGVKSDYALAHALGVKRQAVAAWGKTIPQARQWQIEAMLAREATK